MSAGMYTVTAEYLEGRPGLASSRRSRQAAIQAVAIEIPISPGPPSAMCLQSSQPPTKLAVTNGKGLQDRLLLRNAAIQVKI